MPDQTNRYPRVPQLTKDVTLDNNQATVVGMLGRPYATLTDEQIKGTIPMVDASGNFVNLVSQIPNSALDPAVVDQLSNLVLMTAGGLVYTKDGTDVYFVRRR